MLQSRRGYIPFAASALGGFLVCLVISMATGRREAWDSPAYISVGIPVMCALVCAIRLSFSGSSVALDAKHGCRTDRRNVVGGEFALAVAAFACGHDGALSASTCNRLDCE